jgi:hypothetical protein
MSLSIDGFWKSGFWSQTFWADGVWFEGAYVPPDESNNTGGWPSYGYRRKKRKLVEEIDEKIEAQEVEIQDNEARLAKEKAEKDRIEAKARQSKRDKEILFNLSARIEADMQAIEAMRRVHDEMLTLRYLEEGEDRKRKRRNLIAVLMMVD